MSDKTRNEPLIIVFPHDLSFPIYNFPDDDRTVIFAQVLAALLVNYTNLDDTSSVESGSILNDFVKKMRKRGTLRVGSEALLILPNDYGGTDVNRLDALRKIFEEAGITLHIRFWGDFKQNESIILFAMNANLKSEEEITKFILSVRSRIAHWNELADEYLPQDFI